MKANLAVKDPLSRFFLHDLGMFDNSDTGMALFRQALSIAKRDFRSYEDTQLLPYVWAWAQKSGSNMSQSEVYNEIKIAVPAHKQAYPKKPTPNQLGMTNLFEE